jgi:hypothetical protein
MTRTVSGPPKRQYTAALIGLCPGVGADPERGHGLGLEALDDQVDVVRDRSAT